MAVQQENFCLRWSDFQSNLAAAFQELRNDADFFDVTLATDEDQVVGAHRVVLSACSPHLKEVVRKHAKISGVNQNLLIYLRGVRHADLLAVLEFMYCGSVSVAQEDLNSFLAVAEDLKVRGLSQNQTDDLSAKPLSGNTKNGTGIGKRSKPSTSAAAPLSPSAPPKRFRPSTEVNLKVEAKDDADLVDDGEVVDNDGQYEDDQQEFDYEESGDCVVNEEDAEAGPSDPDGARVEIDDNVLQEGLPDVEEDYELNLNWLIKEKTIPVKGGGSSFCKICRKKIKKNSIKSHFRDKHYQENVAFKCPACNKIYSTRNSIRSHISTHHRDWSGQFDVQYFAVPKTK